MLIRKKRAPTQQVYQPIEEEPTIPPETPVDQPQLYTPEPVPATDPNLPPPQPQLPIAQPVDHPVEAQQPVPEIEKEPTLQVE